ncbi:hypothetical protein pb186bvf_002723 [Paramecium bursaria]
MSVDDQNIASIVSDYLMEGNMEDQRDDQMISYDLMEFNFEYANTAQMQLYDFEESYLEAESQGQFLQGESNIQRVTLNEVLIDQPSFIEYEGSQQFHNYFPDQIELNGNSQIHQPEDDQIQMDQNQSYSRNDFQESKKADGNKSAQIIKRTKNYELQNDSVQKFVNLFHGISIMVGRNIFEQFNNFKNQLNIQLFNQCQDCKKYLMEISLILTKYHLINQEFYEAQQETDQLTSTDLFKDILLTLDRCDEYSDQLRIIQSIINGQEIQLIHEDHNRWYSFAQKFKKQHFINKSFYKSHNCNYRNFIVADNYRRNNMEKEWFDLRNNQIFKYQKKPPQSIAGKKHFVNLMQRHQVKSQQGLISNIGYFTLIVLFNQIRENDKANSLMYADDIFNLIIKYDVFI